MSNRHRDKGRLPPLVPLLKETMQSAAWRAMSPSALSRSRLGTALTSETTVEFTFLYENAANETGLNKDTIARAFRELERYGFIVQTKGGCLGVEGKGKAPHWLLTELGYMADPPTKDFLRWSGTKVRDAKN
jgi:hypothetical protein